MNEPTLYRINYEHPSYSPILDDWIELNVLVPVEPDYEAAEDLPWDSTTKEIVDAVLGIGGDDEVQG